MLSERPRLADRVAHLRQGDLHLLVHPRRPRWAVLNATGYRVACLCDGRRSVAQIAAGLAAQYGQPVGAVRDDVERCLDQLSSAGLLADEGDNLPAPRPALAGLRLHLNLAGGCNLHCIHCGVEPLAAADQLPTADVLRLIDELANGGAEGIALSGGEPLLHDDCLTVLRYAAARLPTVVLATNGTLIDRALAAELVRLGVTVQVSLDGATALVHDHVRGAGAFARAWQGLGHLQQVGIGRRLALSYTLMKPTLADVPQAVDLARQRGIAGLRFFPLQRLGRAAAAWTELAPTPQEYRAVYTYLYRERPRRGREPVVDGGLDGFRLDAPEGEMGCRLGRSLAVDAAGEIYPCSLLMAPGFRLGNVRHTSLAEALASDQLRDLLARCAARMNEIEACRACEWRAFCRAGCPGTAWWLCGTFEATDGLCDLRRELYRETVFARISSSPT